MIFAAFLTLIRIVLNYNVTGIVMKDKSRLLGLHRKAALRRLKCERYGS